ncbi:MAG: restriction endonuclease subunit S [Burkholderiaceae bacterium]|nr:restriction endonuclease subunit S [Burkholderiaceae bacterium]
MQLELCDSAPSDWARLAISHVCQRFTSGGTPSRKLPEYFAGSVPWVKTQELTDCVLRDSEEHITEDAIANSSAKMLPTNTILMAMYGATVGQLGVLARPMTCNQACAAMVVDESKVDHRFLYYQLLACRRQIKSLSTGAAQQNLSGAQIKQFVLPYPRRSEQSVVADFLWQLDRRIDLLRQTNATLESIAQALFKSWFIDFDPVRAKAEGREPEGMDAATAALFPAEFEESALGLIPKGWRLGTVRDACSIFDSRRIPLSGKQRTEKKGIYPYYGAAALMDYVDEFIFDGVYLLLGEDGSVTNADGTPITQYVWGKFWVNNHAHVLQGANGICTEHLMLALRGIDFTPYVTGAVQAKLNQGNLFRIPLLMPTEMVSRAFGIAVRAFYDKVRANSEQAKSLVELRDTLLPRLISGKLRLPEARAQVEEVLA